MPPMAATVAGLEPEMAPKKPEATTEIQARRPGRRLSSSSKKPISRSEIPPSAMMLPARMKKGTAIRVELSTWVNMRVGTAARYWMFPVATMVTAAAMPRQIAMGTPTNRSRNRTPNRMPAAIQIPSFFSSFAMRDSIVWMV